MQSLSLVALALYGKRCGVFAAKDSKGAASVSAWKRFAFGARRMLGGGGATGIGRGDILTEKLVNLRCRFSGYVAYRGCPQISLSLGLRQGVYCLRRHLRRLSLCKFRRRAGCVVGKRSVGSRSVAAGRSLTQSAAIFGRTCLPRQAAFPTSLPRRTFLSCAVWPALVCTLEILLGRLTSARRYVLIEVGVAEAPLFTPTHSCLRPLRL